MARRTFFSFHYKPDVHRAWNVRNSWVTQEREGAGFFDGSVFESKQRTGDDTLKRFLTDGLAGSSVTAALYASQTAWRRWVRFELLRSFQQGKGILSIAIHMIQNLEQQVATPGPNPLDLLAYKVEGRTVRLLEKNGVGSWRSSVDVGPVSASSLPYTLRDGDYKTLSSIFKTYSWADNGRKNLGDWIERAAAGAGR